jgi:hypothetical protein
VAGTAVERRRQALGGLERRLAQRRDTEQLAGSGAFVAAAVVTGARVRVSIAGVEGDEGEVAQIERHASHLERAEVDEERPVGLAEQRCDLIEQAGMGPDPLGLDP